MKTYKTNLPEITLKLKYGETLNCKIENSKDAADVFRKIWDVDSLPIYESMIVLHLNRCNNTIGWMKISQGGISGTVIDIRLVLVAALNCLATSLIIAHNHPSGTTTPSDNDNKITYKLKEGAKTLDIQLYEHIILTEDSYFSYCDNGLI